MNRYCNSTEFLMSTYKIKPSELAKKTDLGERTIYKILEGADNLCLNSINPIADYFDVPYDLLLGRNLDRYKIVDKKGKIVIQYEDDKNMDLLVKLILYHQLLGKR